MKTGALKILALVSLSALGCPAPEIDYVGKRCYEPADCPSNLVCDPASKTCQVSASALDGSTIADGGLAPDAAQPGPDAGPGTDAGTDGGADAGPASDAAVDGGTDAGAGGDAGYGDAGSTSDGGQTSDAGPSGDGGGTTDGGPTSDGGTADGGADAGMDAGADAGCTAGSCGASNWCNGGSCQPCTVDLHCGPSCVQCAGSAPRCDGARCVECTGPADCATGTCLGDGTCATCVDDGQCGPGNRCCMFQCAPEAQPWLSAIRPGSISAALGGTLTLIGQNFSPCATVLLGLEVQNAIVVDAGEIRVTIPPGKLSAGSQYPVAVVNPGGLASNPRSESLGQAIPMSTPGGGALLAVAFIDSQNAAVVPAFDSAANQNAAGIVDVGAWKVRSLVDVSPVSPPLAVGTLDSEVFVGMPNKSLIRIKDPLGTPTLTNYSLSGGNEVVSLIGDPTRKQVLIGEGGRRYAWFDAVTGQVQPSMAVSGLNCCQISGMAFSASGAMFALDTGQLGLFPLPLTSPSWTAISYSDTLAIDESLGVAVATSEAGSGPVATRVFALSNGAPLGTLPDQAYSVAVNSIGNTAVLLVAGTASTVDLKIVDTAVPRVLGVLSQAGSAPGCAQTTQNLLAVDSTSNRALVVSGCANRVHGFNLNVLFVTP